MIDLRVLNEAGTIADVIPLTPFVSEDGHAFIAPIGTNTTRFTSVDGITVIVPAGAFEKPTMVRVDRRCRCWGHTFPRLFSLGCGVTP